MREQMYTHPADQNHHESHERRLLIVVVLSSVYMLAEVVGGWLTGSLALLADSGHLLGDVLGLAMAIAAIRFARRPATADRTYGFYRAEILAALVNSLALLGVAAWILISAWRRLSAPDVDIQATPMLVVAAGGLVVTLIGAVMLYGASKESLNMRGAFLEVVGDLLGAIGTIVAAMIILLTGWVAADALISAVIGVLVVPRAWGLLRSVIDVLLESTPRRFDMHAIEAAMRAVPGVESVHDIHLWSITSGFDAMSGHVRANGRPSEQVMHDLQRTLREGFGIEHVTLQVESTDHADDGACCVLDPRCFVPASTSSLVR